MVPTKTIATVGPASCSAEVLGRFIDEGLDVLRLNMSHGTHGEHRRALDVLRRVADARGVHVAVMADLCGPKVRTGPIDPDVAEIGPGDKCEIVRECLQGHADRFGTNHPGLVDEVDVGHRVLIDDGRIRLRAVNKSGDSLVCTCEVGGTIGTRKGINVPDSNLSLPAMTAKDFVDLAWAIENEVDYVALSFVRSVGDVSMLRDALKRGNGDIPILAKIETPQAIEAIDGIIGVCDGVLVARGDLGVEMDLTRVPILQKNIVVRCRRAGKPVIIATQMLHSMIDQPSPTRAEVSDVANAALDGADAVMLSAESATGRYPVQAVAMMNRICREASRFTGGITSRGAAGRGRSADHFEAPGISRLVRTADPTVLTNQLRVGQEIDQATSAVAHSAAMVAQDLGVKLIAVWCRTGRTAQWLSKYHLQQPLIALSSSPVVCRRLALSYGVVPMLAPTARAGEHALWTDVEHKLAARYGLVKGDFLVAIGDPSVAERACTISIRVVGG